MATSTIKDKGLIIKVADYTYSGTYTIPSSCYLNIATGNEPFKGHKIVGVSFPSWGSNTGAFSLSTDTGNEVYLIGNSGTKVVNPRIRVLYL